MSSQARPVNAPARAVAPVIPVEIASDSAATIARSYRRLATANIAVAVAAFGVAAAMAMTAGADTALQNHRNSWAITTGTRVDRELSYEYGASTRRDLDGG